MLTIEIIQPIKCISMENTTKILEILGSYTLYKDLFFIDKNGCENVIQCLSIFSDLEMIEFKDAAYYLYHKNKVVDKIEELDYESQYNVLLFEFVPFKEKNEINYYSLPKAFRTFIKKIRPSARRFLNVSYHKTFEVNAETLNLEETHILLEKFLDRRFNIIHDCLEQTFEKKLCLNDMILIKSDECNLYCNSQDVTISEGFYFIVVKEKSLHNLYVFKCSNLLSGPTV